MEKSILDKEIIYRKAKKTDFEQYYRLNKLYDDEYKKITFNEQFFKNSHKFVMNEFEDKLKNYFIVAEIGKEIIGYFEGIFNDRYKNAYIADVFVLKEYRKLNIATKMKDLFLEKLKKRKYKEVRLDVNIKNPAINLYNNWGFEITKYRMVKKL